MKTLQIPIIVITLTLLLSSSVPVHARTGILEIKTDKLVYANSDRPVITISASPYSKVELEIDDPYGNAKLSRLFDMPKDGIAIYTLDISWYKPGIYSVTVNMTSSKATTSFAVGLMSPGGEIDFSPVKKSYIPGDNILILGTTNPNIILDLSLIDPNGIQIKKILTYSDKDGHFSSFDFRIPPNAISGIWKIEATRGAIHHYVEINVNFLTSTNAIQNDTNAGILTHDRLVMGTIHIESPLQQFKSGITANDVKCGQGLQLVIKAEDGSPACMKPDTATNLVVRGWAKEIISTSVNAISNMKPVIQNYTGYQSKIIPGPLILSSCGGGGYHSFSNILNSTGFHVFYNITNSGTAFDDDYVIEPGHAGTITYVINAGSSPTPYMTNSYFQKELNITNYAVFYHYVTDYEELLHNPSVTIHNGDYESCFKRPNGSCAGLSGPITGPIQASVVDHPGVIVSFDPASELLQYNDTSQGKSSQIITMTVSVDYDSPQGTYWVVLSPEECLGGKIFLLTIGNQQYHELNR